MTKKRSTKKIVTKTKNVFFKHVLHAGGNIYLPNIKYKLDTKLVKKLKDYIL